MGADLINLRRARKAKGRAEKEREAEANRAKHGIAKPVRDLAKARTEKEKRSIDSHRIEEEK